MSADTARWTAPAVPLPLPAAPGARGWPGAGWRGAAVMLAGPALPAKARDAEAMRMYPSVGGRP